MKKCGQATKHLFLLPTKVNILKKIYITNECIYFRIKEMRKSLVLC